ncbi:nucleoside hydrolase [Helcococcus kunzii]|uniref:nucleoside hydrolase n=1 Tax=Helcococcus kunzii TaxID=40091 RepID=UPI0024AD199B|nr:nucleoside hydrolase [Helcococcus kunzii]
MKKIIIDCDPGHDDAIAICLAHKESQKFKINGITTVVGNNSLGKVTKNTRLILQLLKSNIKIYMGEDKPLKSSVIPQMYHGESGLDGVTNIPKITYPVEKLSAIDFLKKELRKEKTTLVCMGPLTNIAKLIENCPETLINIEEIVLMGGGIQRGNITAFAEFNIYEDPEAADIVFNSGLKITMCGLDVTEKAFVTYEEIKKINSKNLLGKSLFELLDFYYSSGKQFGFKHLTIHDACTIVYLYKPEIFQYKDLNVKISLEGITRGMTGADLRIRPKDKPNVRVVYDVKRDEFAKYLCDALIELDRKLYG